MSRTRLVLAILVIQLAGAAASSVAAQDSANVVRNVNLRISPSSEFPPIRLLQAGTPLIPLDFEPTNNYYPVLTHQGEEGWVWARNVALAASGPEIPRYQRRDWRHWISVNCRNVRNQVLVRQSRTPVRFTDRPDGRECAVASGLWVDPFSGDTIRAPLGLDIDHMVPLHNAHLSGGWNWSRARKQEYANYLADTLHLLAVRSDLNREKSDKSPDAWMPPDTAFSCTYVAAWEGIKGRWDLDMTVRERQAIDSVRQARNCR